MKTVLNYFYGIGIMTAMTLSIAVSVSADSVPVPHENSPHAYSASTAQQSSATREVDPESLAFLLQKLEALQEEMQDIRGKIEVQTHDMKLLSEQQRAFYSDLDQRLSVTNRKLKMAGKNSGISPPGIKHPVVVSDENLLTEQSEPAKESASENSSDHQAYQAAYQLIKNKQYEMAITALNAFIATFPESPYRVNAHYWLGELYLDQSDREAALTHFNTVVTDFSNSNKVPAAMLKIGYIYYDKGQFNEARNELEKVKNTFPESVSARLAKIRLHHIKQRTSS